PALFFLSTLRCPPTPPLFPYTTLFRSRFTLLEGDREILALLPAGTLLERIRQLHGGEFSDALLPVAGGRGEVSVVGFVSHPAAADRKSTRLNSSHVKISYAVFCLKKKK